MKRKLAVAFALAASFAMLFAACAKKAEAPAATAKAFKVAFIYIGPPGDLGWTFEHDRGRKAAVEYFGDKIETAYMENVPEGPDAARVIRQYAQEGYDMIFATSFGYMDPMLEVAKEFPNVKFEHCSGYKTNPNMATYFGRIEEARYLSGIIAGKMTKTNKIGYAAAFPIPEVVRGINAFILGARSVNPKAEVRVVWTNTWYDPVKEREAAVALLDAGCDIIAQHQDTVEPQKAAQERGKLSIGYDSDMGKFVGDTVLASPMWNWGVYYKDTIEKAMKGEWKSHQYWEGLASGVVALSDMSPRVPEDVRKLVLETKDKIASGQMKIFAGPIKDQSGALVVKEGESLPDDKQLSMDWFVQGVVGKVK